MPIRKRSNKRKRKQYKKSYNLARRMPILSGFPKSMVAKLRYSQETILDPSNVSIIVNHTFRANSIFDPDYSGGGHRPLYSSTYDTLYKRYRVLGAKITAYATPQISGTTVPMVWGINLLKDPIMPYTAVDTLYEANRTSKFNLAGGRSMGAAQNLKSMSKTYSAKQFHGVTNVKDNDNLSGLTGGTLVGSNPQQLAYFIVWATNVNGNDPDPQPVRVVIDYIVSYYDPIPVIQSA